MSEKPRVVIGEGWSALGAVGFFACQGTPVYWVTGTGARIMSPLASLEWGPGVAIWAELALKLGVDLGEQRQGSFIREFRNKAFREPLWMKAPTPESRLEVRDEVLWEPERRFVGAIDSRFRMSLGEIEEEFRTVLLSGRFPHLKRFEGVPVTSFRKGGHGIEAVQLASGVELECDHVIYADRWSLLSGLEGLPKALSFLRNRVTMGVLQASFLHRFSLGAALQESFFATLNKEAGDKLDKHVWGYFTSCGMRSRWSLCLSPEEVENNHEIAKKFRRMKTTLDKIFAGSNLIPEGFANFGATILEEQVRFGEEAIDAAGSVPSAPYTEPGLSGISFFTDTYGPSSAFQQVGSALGINPVISSAVQGETAPPN